MKRERTEAIILHTFPSRERDKLVVFLTPEHGKQKGWAYGARGGKHRFGASLEPLSKVSIGYVVKENEEVVRIESVDLIRSLFSAQQNLVSSIAGTYIAEMVDTFALPDDPSEVLYRLLDRCCEALLAGTSPLAVTVYAEIWTLKISGTFPSLKACFHCHEALVAPLHFDSASSGFVGLECVGRNSVVVPNDVSGALVDVLRLPLAEFALRATTRTDLFELRSIARAIRRSFLGHELKTHDLLGSLFSQ